MITLDFKTIQQVAGWISQEYLVEPTYIDDDELRYERCTIKKAKPGMFKQMTVADQWCVERKGHTEDFMRKAELERELDAGGGLLYFIIPEDRHW